MKGSGLLNWGGDENVRLTGGMKFAPQNNFEPANEHMALKSTKTRANDCTEGSLAFGKNLAITGFRIFRGKKITFLSAQSQRWDPWKEG